jgi:hypothetical protein
MIREMGLQVILSAPTEKMGDIAPLVDRNLLVHRLKKATLEAGEQLTAAYRTRLEKMKKDPAYAGFDTLIDLMLELNIRLEQEALLADGELPLADNITNCSCQKRL